MDETLGVEKKNLHHVQVVVLEESTHEQELVETVEKSVSKNAMTSTSTI